MRNYAIDLAGITEENRVNLVNLLQRKGEVITSGGFILQPIIGSLPYRYLIYDNPDSNWCGDNSPSNNLYRIPLTEFLLKYITHFKEL